jgi:hypothetical protein
MIPLLINQSNISRVSLAIVEMSSGFRSSCYWTDWNWANTENIRIGLIFAILAQWTFLYCIDRFDHIKANKSKLINNHNYKKCILFNVKVKHVLWSVLPLNTTFSIKNLWPNCTGHELCIMSYILQDTSCASCHIFYRTRAVHHVIYLYLIIR